MYKCENDDKKGTNPSSSLKSIYLRFFHIFKQPEYRTSRSLMWNAWVGKKAVRIRLRNFSPDTVGSEYESIKKSVTNLFATNMPLFGEQLIINYLLVKGNLINNLK